MFPVDIGLGNARVYAAIVCDALVGYKFLVHINFLSPKLLYQTSLKPNNKFWMTNQLNFKHLMYLTFRVTMKRYQTMFLIILFM